MNSFSIAWVRVIPFHTGILLLDGLMSTGKTMIMNILDAYPDVSALKFNYRFENLCKAFGDMKIDDFAGRAGNFSNQINGLKDSWIDGVSTYGIVLPMWDIQSLEQHLNTY
jgi:hypothetical protein